MLRIIHEQLLRKEVLEKIETEKGENHKELHLLERTDPGLSMVVPRGEWKGKSMTLLSKGLT